MSRRPLIFDEEEIGKRLYENGNPENLATFERTAITKYMRQFFEAGDAKTKTLVKGFFGRDKFFNIIRMGGVIGKLVKSSRFDFLKTENVQITKKELDFIREHKSFRHQIILLGILFVSKRKSNNGYLRLKEWADVKSISSLKINNSEISEVFYNLYSQDKAVRPIEREDRDPTHEVLFLDKELQEIVFDIKTDREARNLGKLYREWCGGELGWCKDCGVEFVKNASTSLYCETHKKERRKLKYKKYNGKRNIV